MSFVSLPPEFLSENFVPFVEQFDTLFCPSCRQRSFYEMRGPIPLGRTSTPTTWYWCSNCYLQVRKSELNDVIDKYLGETKTIKIDMTSVLTMWLKRAQAWLGLSGRK